MNRARSVVLLFFTGLLVFASTLMRGAESSATAPEKCVLAGQTYLFRWAEQDHYEFTPAGQEDLQHWSDMVTVVLHRGVTTNDQLADLANRVLGNYQAAHAIVIGTHSKPRTATEPAEHFAAVAFPQPTMIEVAFARVKLVDGVGCAFVYSHREYGEKIGDQVSAWLKANGPTAEKNLMSWKAFPHPKEFSSNPAKTKKPYHGR